MECSLGHLPLTFLPAGYRQGAVPLPTPPATRSVTDFRKPGGSDTQMLQDALAWAHAQPIDPTGGCCSERCRRAGGACMHEQQGLWSPTTACYLSPALRMLPEPGTHRAPSPANCLHRVPGADHPCWRLHPQ